MSKSEGFVQKYQVLKYKNPQKRIDCIVLEFDDPIARKGIQAWAEAMNDAGYHKCAAQVLAKLCRIEGIE
jgi:hypothetical protein